MTDSNWQLQTPINTIIFDCDGTLSTIEGIDELASANNVGETVKELTEKAMGSTGMYPELYEQRIALVKPTYSQVQTLGKEYFTRQSPNAIDVVHLLQHLNKTIYIISAGLYPAVKMFGELLSVPEKNIFAVNINFDEQGHYLDFDKTSPLTYKNGKRDIVEKIKIQHPEIIYIGDGLNDLATYDLATRFIGYGGAYFRKNIAKQCQFYIATPTMTTLLPLCLTEEESKKLTGQEKYFYEMGLHSFAENMGLDL